MTVYPLQHRDIHSVHRPHEAKIFPVSNQQHQTTTVALGTTVLQSHHIPPGLNVVGSTVKPQPLKGVIAPMSVLPCTSSVVGTTDLRYVNIQNIWLPYENFIRNKLNQSYSLRRIWRSSIDISRLQECFQILCHTCSADHLLCWFSGCL